MATENTIYTDEGRSLLRQRRAVVVPKEAHRRRLATVQTQAYLTAYRDSDAVCPYKRADYRAAWSRGVAEYAEDFEAQ